jgi:hypothetical protein
MKQLIKENNGDPGNARTCRITDKKSEGLADLGVQYFIPYPF